MTGFTKYNENIQVGGSLQTPNSTADTNTNTFAFGNNVLASGQYSHAEGTSTIASGLGAHAEGYKSLASGSASHAEGGGDSEYDFSGGTAIGAGSHAEGSQTTANGVFSHTEGVLSLAKNDISHAEGFNTIAGGNNQEYTSGHAEGVITAVGFARTSYDYDNGGLSYNSSLKELYVADDLTLYVYPGDKVAIFNNDIGGYTQKTRFIGTVSTITYSGFTTITLVEDVIGSNINYVGINQFLLWAEAETNGSHAEGFITVAGPMAHAEGVRTISFGQGSHAEGYYTKANNRAAHAEGFNTTASGLQSHSEGVETTASGDASHAEGGKTTSYGYYSHSEGQYTLASGTSSHAEGYNTTAIADYSHSEGSGTTASGQYSHAGGLNSIASNIYAFSHGYGSQALSTGSTAFGQATYASGLNSFACGMNTYALGDYGAHSEGYYTTASGDKSHAEGVLSIASGIAAHAEGSGAKATAESSHAEGHGTTASAFAAHAGGYLSVASGPYSFVHGSGSTASGSATIVLGYGITGTSNDTTYVDNFNIRTLGGGASVANLGIDANGYVVTGTTGGGSTPALSAVTAVGNITSDNTYFTSNLFAENVGIGMTAGTPSFKFEAYDYSTGSGWIGRYSKPNLVDGEWSGLLFGAGPYREGVLQYFDNQADPTKRHFTWGIGGDAYGGVSIYQGGRLIINNAGSDPVDDGTGNRLQVNGASSMNGDVYIGTTATTANLTYRDGNQGNGKVLVSNANGLASWVNPSSLTGVSVSLSAVTAVGNTTTNDIEITDFNRGVILRSPDNTRWRITVDNSGSLITTIVP